MEIIYLLTGLIVGALLGIGLTKYFKQNKQLVDISNFENNIKNLQEEVKGYKEKVIEERGKTDQLAKDMRESVLDVNKIAENLKTTLVSGGSQNQGAWGELLLKNILDSIGFREGEEYHLQKVFKNEDGKDQKPDVIVHYPGKRHIIIDSKVSLTAWDKYINATDEKSKSEALEEHIDSVKNHIKNLAKKNYHDLPELNTLDSVIMFTPNEQSILALGKQYQEIMNLGFSGKIFLVGPTSLYFTLKTVEHHWKAEKQEKNYNKIINMFDKMSSQAVDIYNSIKTAKLAIEKSVENLSNVLNNIQDGRQSFLGRIQKIIKFGRLTPKKKIPEEVKENIETENQDQQAISLKNKKSDICLSAGNTGAVMLSSSLILGRISGVERAAISAVLPSRKGPVVMLDMGIHI